MRNLIQITILTLGVVILAGCASKNTKTEDFNDFAYGNNSSVTLTPEQHEQVADGFMRRGNDEMAFMHYNKALSKDGSNLDIRVKKGDLLVTKGLEEQALAEYLKVMEIDPDHSIANGSAGAVYFRAGLYTEARAHLEKAVRLNPLLWKSHNYLGILNDRDGNYDMAADNFATALDLNHNGNKAEIYNNLGVVHMARKQYGLAVDAFRRALKNGQVSARTYNNLGLALTRMGRLDEALESFKYAGGEARANNNLGYVLLTNNQPGKAVAYFERALELSPNFYVKAADNLKRARLAARFKTTTAQAPKINGSTPNPLLRKSFPDTEQNPDGPAASPASAGPSSGDILKISYEKRNGGDVNIHTSTYGLHVSSWRDHTNAFNHCARLQKQGFTTWINQVDLGSKGIWYRVLVGHFPSVKSATEGRPDVLAVLGLKRASVFERITPSPDGSHLK